MQTGKISSAFIIVLACVVVVIGVIWLLMAMQTGSQTEEVETEEEKVTTPVPTPSATATPVPEEAGSSRVETTTITDVTGGESQGTATRLAEEGKDFTHSVEATLPDLPEGEFYEGWLVKEDDSAFISTGKMTKSGSDYTLDFISATNYQDYPKVVITREKVDDEQPETHILEGTFTERLLL